MADDRSAKGRRKQQRISEGVMIALITAGATVLVSVITGGFGLLGSGGDAPVVSPPSTVTVTVTVDPNERIPLPDTSESGTDSTADSGRASSAFDLVVADELHSAGSWTVSRVHIGGTRYTSGLSTTACYQRARDYNLGGGYRTLRGVVGIEDNSTATAPTQIRIVGDGRVLQRHTVELGEHVQLDVPVAHVVRLSLQVEESSCSTTIAWANPRAEP